MKKSLILLLLLLWVALLCSCGHPGDQGHTSSEKQETVMGINSDQDLSSNAESALAESSTDTPAVDSKTASDPNTTSMSGSKKKGEKSSPVRGSEIQTSVSDPNTANVPSSENKGESSSPAGNSEAQTSSGSDESTDSSFFADEYELPFIPK